MKRFIAINKNAYLTVQIGIFFIVNNCVDGNSLF